MSDNPIKENRIVQIGTLAPHPRNYRIHPKHQIDQLALSLQRFGQGRSIVVQDSPEHPIIVAGHGIVEAAQALQWQELRADILPADWTDTQVEGYLIADNLHSQEASDNEELLAMLLQEQQDAGFDLRTIGTDDETLRQMLEAMGDGYLAGDTSEDDTEQSPRQTLADRFIIPPFSVLDARQGYWQERKRAWIALGIQSELGRGEHSLGESEAAERFGYHSVQGGITEGNSPQVTEPGLNYYRNQEKAKSKNGLLGESEQARSHYNGKGLARSYGQDLMRGEHVVGESGKRLTWVAGDRSLDELDETSRKNLAGGRRAADQRSNINGAPPKPSSATGTGTENMAAGTSIFDPVLCELIYRWFSPPDGVVLDPFAGGSVRGIVAAKTGRQYVGLDLRQEQIEANEAQARAILSKSTSVVIDASDLTQDYTPELAPVMEHGGYLVKRDDLYQIAGVRGSKVRTIWALAQGAIGLVTSGSRHSPHVHRVAAIAQRLGIPCRVHIATGENTPDVQGAEDAGAEIIRHKAGYLNVLNARAREDTESLGWTLIPFGVVCQEAVRQIKGQTANLPQEMKRLVVAVGSGISLSGILHGMKEHNINVPVLGVTVGKDPLDVINEYAPKDWHKAVTLVQSPLKFEEHPKDTRLGDIPLDPTYEAKCLPYLQDGDVLWSIGIRASEVDAPVIATQSPMPKWIVGDSRNLSDFCTGIQADLIFTCPPYYDLEVYSDNPDDLSTVSTYSEFIEDYRAILKQAIAQLKDNRFVCLVVGDIRDKKGFYRNFVSDTITACQDAGAKLYNEAILVTSVGSLPIRVGKQFSSGRKLGKTHQNVLVFCKGDPRKAVEACGDVVVEVSDEEVIEEMEEVSYAR